MLAALSRDSATQPLRAVLIWGPVPAPDPAHVGPRDEAPRCVASRSVIMRVGPRYARSRATRAARTLLHRSRTRAHHRAVLETFATQPVAPRGCESWLGRLLAVSADIPAGGGRADDVLRHAMKAQVMK
jgi:hypothetical protein